MAAAIAACANGARAIVIERCGGPVDKACGEGLMPNAVARLAQMGVVPPAWGTHPFRGIRYIDATSGRRVCAEADFSQGPGLGVRRLALSEALRARAQATEGYSHGTHTVLRTPQRPRDAFGCLWQSL